MPQSEHGALRPHRGVLILILGIVSIVACAILGPVAWILGQGDLREIDKGSMDPEGRGLTQAGMICGIIGTVLLVLGLAWLVLAVVIGVSAAASGY